MNKLLVTMLLPHKMHHWMDSLNCPVAIPRSTLNRVSMLPAGKS